MGLFTSFRFETLHDLFVQQLEDLYDAEQRLTRALPKMADAANSSELKNAFMEHLAQTERQVIRLEQVFQMAGKEPTTQTCEAMKGLIQEGDDIINAQGDPDVRDAGLIAAAQRVEHYEIAAYGTCRNFAERLGLTEAASLLQETLDEEKETDMKLTQIAEQSVNVHAAQQI